jgi:hypothetical protein
MSMNQNHLVLNLFITRHFPRISATLMFITFHKVNKMFISTRKCEKIV